MLSRRLVRNSFEGGNIVYLGSGNDYYTHSGADYDPDGDSLSVVTQTLTTANGSTVTISTDGQFTVNLGEISVSRAASDDAAGFVLRLITGRVQEAFHWNAGFPYRPQRCPKDLY